MSSHRIEQIGPCRLILGDCADVLETLEAGSVDCVVTSPPYDNLRTYGGHSWSLDAVIDGLLEAVRQGGAVVWVVNDQTVDGDESGTSFRQALRFKEAGFKLHDTMIWDKSWCQYGDTASRYAGTFEFMFVFSNGKIQKTNIIRDRKNVTAGTRRVSRFDRRVTGGSGGKVTREKPHIVHEYSPRKAIWEIPVDNSQGGQHPAVFPVSLARDHILSWTNEGDTVLDCFTGSGTTAVACIKTGRNFVGCEVNETYFDLACNRIRKAWAEKRSELQFEPEAVTHG